MTSWSLIDRAREAVPQAREQFARRYGNLIRSYLASRWRVPADHDRIADATQEVFVRCFKPGGVLERVDPKRPAGFRPFLRGVVCNVALEFERDARRRGNVHVESPSTLERLEKDQTGVSRAFDRAWAEMVTAEAWALASERISDKRGGGLRVAVLRSYFVDGRRPREIASELGLDDAREVYRTLEVGRYQFRIAMLTVMGSFHPNLSPSELERKCEEVVELL